MAAHFYGRFDERDRCVAHVYWCRRSIWHRASKSRQSRDTRLSASPARVAAARNHDYTTITLENPGAKTGEHLDDVATRVEIARRPITPQSGNSTNYRRLLGAE